MWGKWGEFVEPLPLLGHMLDTAAFALDLWPQLSGPLRVNAADLLAAGDEELGSARFGVLAALHDLGKASREFQGQLWTRQHAQFAANTQALASTGLPMDAPPRPVLSGLDAAWLRHEAVTGLILKDRTGLPAWARRVVAGHHGRYQPAQSDVAFELDALHARASDPAWAAVQSELIDTLVTAVSTVTGTDTGLDGWPRQASCRQSPLLVALTGWVCVADWLASDDGFVARAFTSVDSQLAPRDLLEADPSAYLALRRLQAGTVLNGVLTGSGTPAGSFSDLFGGLTPRGAAQRWAAAREHGPGLRIVMAPMGEGKTELALYVHSAMPAPAGPSGRAAGKGMDGLFFGLPTMATADAMFDRVCQFWQGTAATGRLAHGQAVLHDYYQAIPHPVAPVGVCDEDDAANAGLTPADWFSGRHRGLLAPVTVGTCDQVLAAALSHKFLPVRLAALAGKHVVLDEVHTYDPYQQQLLCRLLSWLGAYRCRVTLLSATLPRARVAELCAAWTSGWHADDKPAVRDALNGALPPTLPYPSVVSVDDALGCEPLEAWRRFELELVCHRLPADRTGMLTATAAAVARLRADQPKARIGVLVNTVDRAIGVYQALASSEPGQTVLLHSRMTAAQRRQRTKQLHHLVGQHAAAGPVLVVATQVAEASLDLDLDLLVSDLAPMASLLQRTGRLWRHSVNTGHGWTHPPHLAYRTGNPTVHVLAPVDDEGRVAAGAAALPYTTAELQATWSKPACLDGGARRAMSVPGDVQAAVDSAHLTLADLVDPARSGPAGRESAETQAVLAHLADQLAKSSAAQRVGMAAHEMGRWRPDAGQDPWGADSPDWSALTGPTLWDAKDGIVTRLQERDQATVLLCDPTGTTPWAWTGEPAALLRPGLSRATLREALGATVPVSGALARRLRERAREHLPPDWAAIAPVLLRGILPLPVTALDSVAYLDASLGLIRQEQP